MPDDVAQEKVNALRCLGAQVERVRPASIVDTKHVRNRSPNVLHPLTEYLFCSMWYVSTHSDNRSKLKVTQNLARKAAEKFSISEVESPNSKHTLTSSDSLLITTTHDITVNSTAEENDQLQSEPRGFFADQFEVRSK